MQAGTGNVWKISEGLLETVRDPDNFKQTSHFQFTVRNGSKIFWHSLMRLPFLRDGFEWMGKLFKWRIYLPKRFSAEFEDCSLTRDLVRDDVGWSPASDKSSRRLRVVPICCDLILIGCVWKRNEAQMEGKQKIPASHLSVYMSHQYLPLAFRTNQKKN